MPDITLITGGVRSGKSNFAVTRARHYSRRAFVATATPCDDEMAARIAAHRRERGDAFSTVEAPLELGAAVEALRDCDVAVVDCLTVWLGNLMHAHGSGAGVREAVEAFLRALEDPPCALIVVTNEVGMGIVPDNAMAREFRDLAGSVHARVARRAERVILMVAGIPMIIKGTL